VLGFAGLSTLRLRKELIERRMLEGTNPNFNNYKDDDDNKNINTTSFESKLEG